MRDYNQIPFRSPGQKQSKGGSSNNNPQPPRQQQQQQQEQQQHPVSPNGEKGTTSTTASTNASQSSSEAPRTASPYRSASPTPMPSRQRQQQQQQHVMSSPRSSHSASTATNNTGNNNLSPNDALLLRREGPEAAITKLRHQLETATAEAQSSRSAASKSEAVILELRSTVRQLKRQVDAVQSSSNNRAGGRFLDDSGSAMSARDAEIGELKVQLDKAHAQIITADMVRKELEDTLEAEQYTWELRVQDQDRTIAELQAAISALQKQNQKNKGGGDGSGRLQQELDQARQDVEHWKSVAEKDQSTSELHERIVALEQERSELQGCLDEALKELEAVDAELQNDSSALLREENERLQEELKQQKGAAGGNSVEPLQHLYRWVLERDGKKDDNLVSQKSSAPDLVKAIQSHLEEGNELPEKVKELESQVSVYRGDLKAREDSSTELRASLKEAVALLKPLQDAVAKADKEKARLQDQLEKAKAHSDTSLLEIRRYKELLNLKDDEIDALKQEIESLELQLSKAKLETANSVVSQHSRSFLSSPGSGGDEEEGSMTSPSDRGRAKRKSEETLKKMLSDAQSRFSTLNKQAQQVEEQNNELQGRLRQASDESPGKSELDRMQKRISAYEARIHELENEASVRQGELSKKDVEMRNLQIELEQARSSVRDLHQNDNRDNEEIERAEFKVQQLEKDLAAKNKDLAAKKEAHRALNTSLKDALGLIKPLQHHLEEAEEEKRELAEELNALRQQAQNASNNPANGSRSMPVDGSDDVNNQGKNASAMRHLEKTVQQLERENAQLHDALEDMSHSINASHISSSLSPQQKKQSSKAEARLRAELVEIKSRYEVTQSRLEDSFVENHTLVEALQKREKEEKDMVKELEILRERLAASEAELDSAKYIATSALVKIEQLTTENGVSRQSGKSLDDLYREKRKQIEQEMSKLI